MINSIGVSNINSNYNSQPISTAAAPKAGETEFNYNAQDEVVMAPTTAGVAGVKQGKNAPSTSRISLGTTLKPNDDGNYVFDPKTQTKDFTSSITFATVNNTLSMFEKAYGDKIPWATGSQQMQLNPDKGEMLNAYYSRNDNSINFFHATDTQTNQMIYSGHSGEVVSHEVGHAILDGLHPSYLSTWGPDPSAFHESFGDMTGFFMSIQDDKTVEIAAKQTGGDMKKPNILAQTGEQLGTTIGHVSGKPTGGYIRNAINDYKWSDPSTLPSKPTKRDELSTECHSWSRLFTGTMYDAFSSMVSRDMADGKSAQAAIKDSGNALLTLYANLMKEAPEGNFTFKQMANSILKTDAKYMGGQNQDILRTAFTERRILPEGVTAMDTADTGAKNTRMMTVSLDGDGFGMFSGAKVDTPVDADKVFASEADSQEASDLKSDMKNLIDSGRIKYTEPNQTLEHKDYFDKDGVPYMGVVRWVDGSMVIERNHVIE